jgi:prepilin-type N-terminal cleavage/methylation domain-containing protein
MKSTEHFARWRAFTLLELLVVMGLVAVFSLLLIGRWGNGGREAALKSAQAMLANLVTVARTNALANGRSARILVQVDPASASDPQRYLRYVVVQLNTVEGWQTVTDTFLPSGIYIVPGNFSSLPGGLFATSVTIPWRKADGTDLRSTALRSDQLFPGTINGVISEQWVGVILSSTAGTLQSGDIVLAMGRRKAPGSYAAGDAPIELMNPADVRGLTLSSYGVPAFINARTSF